MDTVFYGVPEYIECTEESTVLRGLGVLHFTIAIYR
jgi:hypothetical protein